MPDNEKIILPQVSLRPRRPRALFAPEPPTLPRPARIALGALLVVMHGLALWAIARLDARDDGMQAADSALLVTFITRPESRREDEQNVVVSIRPPTPKAPAARVRPGASPPNPPRSVSPAPHPDAGLRASLYGRDGRLQLPQATVDALARVDGGDREFSYQVPGLDRADKLLEHRTVLEYHDTRFAKMYRPNQDLLTDLLTRMVEATTREVRIPAPGNPKATIVCQISILALGGSCGVQDGDGWMPTGDDPDTLNPEEDRACQAWWDKIVAATNQDVWRRTRALYDAQCRKPLERKPPQPPLPAPAN